MGTDAFRTKKSVLLVVRWPVGGIRTFLRYVYAPFDPEKWHFTILAPQDAEVDALKEDLRALDIDYVLTNPNPSALGFTLAVSRQLLKHRYDLIHSHGFTSAICSSLSCLLLLKKHLVTSHDVLNAEQFVGLRGELKRLMLGLVLNSSAHVHSVGQDAQENLLSFLPRVNKQCCSVIPNGIEIERFLVSPVKKLHDESRFGGAFLVGFFGRFMSQKGFRYIVDAIEILASDSALDKRPVVMAFGWGGFVEREKRNIQARGLENYFHFMPFESNVAGVLKGVDVVVMPSLWEACGLLAMEALVCGTPLIATECVGLREVIRDTPTIKVEMRDGSEIAEAIKGLMSQLSNKKYTDFIPEAARRFDVSRQSHALESLYQQLIC